MISPWNLFTESLHLFWSNLLYLIKFGILKALINYPPVLLIAGIMYSYGKISTTFSGGLPNLPFVFLLVPLALIFMVVSLWLNAASTFQYYSISTAVRPPIKELLSRGWSLAWKLFFTGLLAGLAVMGGLVLFIIPGLIFAVWFTFSTQIVIAEGASGVSALKRSKALISNRFWKLAYYISFPLLIVIGLVIVSSILGRMAHLDRVFNAVVSLVAGSIFSIYSFLVYREFAK